MDWLPIAYLSSVIIGTLLVIFIADDGGIE